VLAIAAMVAIAIPLAASSSLSESQAAVRRADLPMALELARQAKAVEPFAARPHVQEALILESQGSLLPAAAAAARATEREPHEWRAWVIRSRIDAERGDAKASLAAYRKAKSLNPDSVLFKE
jgi:tetratricopeptide (TPR) repeat protein